MTPRGLAAGPNARGLAFGEPGAGVDPGARLLGSALRWTVGADTEWAQPHADARGFSWTPGPMRQHFLLDDCNCFEFEGEARS